MAQTLALAVGSRPGASRRGPGYAERGVESSEPGPHSPRATLPRRWPPGHAAVRSTRSLVLSNGALSRAAFLRRPGLNVQALAGPQQGGSKGSVSLHKPAPMFAGPQGGREGPGPPRITWPILAAALSLLLAASASAAGVTGSAASAPSAAWAAAVRMQLTSLLTTAGRSLPPGIGDALTLLSTAVVAVVAARRLPGGYGGPILGYLVGGAVIGPHGFGLVAHPHIISHIAEVGVILLLFEVGLDLSLPKLNSLAKYVFGLGSLQVLLTASLAGMGVAALGFNAATAAVVGLGLAFSSTAVVLQVLKERGETDSRHGQAAFGVLLMQDLSVICVFVLIPLLGSAGRPLVLARALGLAAVKTAVCVAFLVAVGRRVLRPLFRVVASAGSSEVMAATTLGVALGASCITAGLGLSTALGAFLAGVALSDTEYALQVQSDLAPFLGQLLGLFFLTVGMNINARLFTPHIAVAIVLLIIGKAAVVAAAGRLVGLTPAVGGATGLYLAGGGEFSIVTFAFASAHGLLPPGLEPQLVLVVALSMAVTPILGSLSRLLLTRTLGGAEAEAEAHVTSDVGAKLSGHVIVAGYGRSGRIISAVLSELKVQHIVLDADIDRVRKRGGKKAPVFFGDAASEVVLRQVGAERASAAILTSTDGSSSTLALHVLRAHFPKVKVFCRAVDEEQGLELQKAGASIFIPSMVEPALQIVSAVLSTIGVSPERSEPVIDSQRARRGGWKIGAAPASPIFARGAAIEVHENEMAVHGPEDGAMATQQGS